MEKSYSVVVEQKVTLLNSEEEVSTPEVDVRKIVVPDYESKEEAEKGAYEWACIFAMNANVMLNGMDANEVELPVRSYDSVYVIGVDVKKKSDNEVNANVSWKIHVE